MSTNLFIWTWKSIPTIYLKQGSDIQQTSSLGCFITCCHQGSLTQLGEINSLWLGALGTRICGAPYCGFQNVSLGESEAWSHIQESSSSNNASHMFALVRGLSLGAIGWRLGGEEKGLDVFLMLCTFFPKSPCLGSFWGICCAFWSTGIRSVV